jgi:hypothetical protein
VSITIPDQDESAPEDDGELTGYVEIAARAVARMEDLERARQEFRDELAARIAAADLDDRELAEIYWRFDAVPVASLGTVEEVLRKAQAYPYWSWRCGECGTEVFVMTRTEVQAREQSVKKHQRRAAQGRPWGDEYMWTCSDCWAARMAGGEAAHERRIEALQLREQELRTMPYTDFLLTPEWQETRRAALRRAGFACQVCNTGERLHVHHRTYERRGAELARDLIVLCGPCHALYHGKGMLPAHPDGGHDDGTDAAEGIQGPAAAAWVACVIRDTGRDPSWRELGAAMNVPVGYSAFIRMLIDWGSLAWQEGTARSLRPGPLAEPVDP